MNTTGLWRINQLSINVACLYGVLEGVLVSLGSIRGSITGTQLRQTPLRSSDQSPDSLFHLERRLLPEKSLTLV